MAKILTQKQNERVVICFECGFIPNKKIWDEICLKRDEHYDAIRYMADQLNISDDEMVTIACLESKEELHVVAANYHWDGDSNQFQSLYAIIDHPLCDAGTALLLFWKGGGYRFMSPNPRFATENEIKFYEEIYYRFKNKVFNTYDIAFNPYDEDFVPSLDECFENNYFIPGEFFCPYSRMFVEGSL